MNPQRISELLARRSELKAKGEYQAAIPLQLEILERLSKTEASPERMASAHNYASVLYSGVRSYAMAETHARLALDYPLGDSHKAHESRATYLFVLARILAAQERFDEALICGEEAIREFRSWHHPPDDFLAWVIQDVDAIRTRTWRPPPEWR